MIVEEKHGIVREGGVMESTQFTIEANAKMFKMLTDALYSNKIQSVVRELSSNAWDSHIEAGHKRPFEVQCPTWGKPVFSIRDYGFGLSHEKVIQVYTVLGRSDKTESNDYVGCLGIGSKSPFAYTNNFSVTSINAGTKRIYTCFVNEEGIPTISLLAEEKTKEESGLKIEIAIKPGDSYAFEEVIKNNYLFYDVKPKCNVKLNEVTITKEFSVPNCDISSYVSNSHGAVKLVMGHNVYTLEKEFAGVGFEIPYSKFLLLTVPIGHVNVDISRERLQFDKKTTAALTTIYSDIKNHLLKDTQAELDKCKSKLEAITKVRTLNGIQLRNYKSLLTYKNETLDKIINSSMTSSSTVFMIHSNGNGTKERYIRLGNTPYVVDDDKVSLGNIKANFFIPKQQKGYFIKPKDEAEFQKVMKELNDFGIPEDMIHLTSKLNLKKKGTYSPIKVMKVVGTDLTEVKALPGKSDYYIPRNGKQIGIDKVKLKIINFLGISVYALTPTQVKKYECKDVMAEMPNLIGDFLKKNNVTANYYGVTFGCKYILNIFKKEFPEFMDYFKQEKEFQDNAEKVNKLIPNDIKHHFLGLLPNKSLDIDGMVYKQFPLLKHLSGNNYSSEAYQDVVSYIQEKKNVTICKN